MYKGSKTKLLRSYWIFHRLNTSQFYALCNSSAGSLSLTGLFLDILDKGYATGILDPLNASEDKTPIEILFKTRIQNRHCARTAQ